MGTRENRLVEAVLTSTHNLCFEQKYEKYQNFLCENFHFLVLKFSVYLNRHVFVMYTFHVHSKTPQSADAASLGWVGRRRLLPICGLVQRYGQDAPTTPHPLFQYSQIHDCHRVFDKRKMADLTFS